MEMGSKGKKMGAMGGKRIERKRSEFKRKESLFKI